MIWQVFYSINSRKSTDAKAIDKFWFQKRSTVFEITGARKVKFHRFTSIKIKKLGFRGEVFILRLMN